MLVTMHGEGDGLMVMVLVCGGDGVWWGWCVMGMVCVGVD